MSRATKRTITASLLMAAAAAVLIALGLAGGDDKASASTKKGSGDKDVLVSIKTVKVKPDQPKLVVTKPEPKPEPKPKPEPPKVDVVFALDTTGSMGGLIRGAKRKIWSMANQIVAGQPRPHVRIGLIGYRDLGDRYVTRRYALSEDMDDVYARLRRFRADGGGDTPEHVNRALADAIRKMKWRKGDKVLRMIFLVGDAPPHEGRSGLYSSALSREAKRKGIVINTVRCGRMGSTARKWRTIASLSGGMYSSIRQDGAMIAITTPVDRELAELNKRLSATLVPTGSGRDRAAARARRKANYAMSAPVQAESAKYRVNSGRLDSKDLLTVLGKGRKLEDVPPSALPAPVAAMPMPARRAYVSGVKSRRARIKAKIKKLSRSRDSYIKARRPKGAPKSFDDTLGDALEAQGSRAGIKY